MNTLNETAAYSMKAEEDLNATGAFEIQPATDADTPEAFRAYSSELIASTAIAAATNEYLTDMGGESYSQVLSLTDTGETVEYDSDSGEFIRHNPNSGEVTIVPQELTAFYGELPPELEQQIEKAQTFDDAVQILYNNKNPDPMVQVAIIGRIGEKFHSEDSTAKIDELVVDTVRHASDNTAVSSEVVIESMIYAVDVVSADSKGQVLDTLRTTLHSVETANHEVVDAVNSALEDMSESNTGSFRSLVEEHAERNHLIDERRALMDRLEEIDQKIVNVNESIEEQIGTPKRRRVLPGLRNLLQFAH